MSKTIEYEVGSTGNGSELLDEVVWFPPYGWIQSRICSHGEKVGAKEFCGSGCRPNFLTQPLPGSKAKAKDYPLIKRG